MTERLQGVLGLPSLVFYGAGIYSILGPAAGVAGEGLWASFALAAVAAVLTGLSYAKLATMSPRAGGDDVYAKEAFPRLGLLPPVRDAFGPPGSMKSRCRNRFKGRDRLAGACEGSPSFSRFR